MKCIFSLVLSLLMFSCSCFANSGWLDCEFPGVLKFKFPPTLMLREGIYDDMLKALKNHKDGIRTNLRLNFVPVDASNRTCFVNVRCLLGRKAVNDFYQPISITTDELNRMQGDILLGAAQDLKTQVDLTNPLEVYDFDDKHSLFMEYHYPRNNKLWYSYFYHFNDGDKRYRVIIRVRSDKYKEWIQQPNDIREIVRTLVPVRS